MPDLRKRQRLASNSLSLDDLLLPLRFAQERTLHLNTTTTKPCPPSATVKSVNTTQPLPLPSEVAAQNINHPHLLAGPVRVSATKRSGCTEHSCQDCCRHGLLRNVWLAFVFPQRSDLVNCSAPVSVANFKSSLLFAFWQLWTGFSWGIKREKQPRAGSLVCVVTVCDLH